MTEKIRLKDGTELNLIPMGIAEKSNLRVFKFTSEMAHEEMLEKFDESNIEKIDYILADESIGATYKDCIVLKSLTFVPNVQADDNTLSDVYMATISTDPLERGMKTLRSEMESMANTMIMMFMPMM